MDLLHLVDRLEELVAGAQKMPIGNRAIVDRRRILDLIDQMRIAIPHEVREAQDIVAQRDAIRREAEEEGRIIVAQAEERASDLVEEHSIAERAKERAEEIAVEAERRLEEQIERANQDVKQRIHESRRVAREQMAAADEYARELLLRLERQLQAFQNSVRAGVDQLEPQPTTFEETLPPEDAAEATGGYRAYDAGPASGLAGSRPGVAASTGPGGFEDHFPSDEVELEDLLNRSGGDLDDVEAADPGVIDDFEHQPLDDDPVLRPASRPPGERPPSEGGGSGAHE